MRVGVKLASTLIPIKACGEYQKPIQTVIERGRKELIKIQKYGTIELLMLIRKLLLILFLIVPSYCYAELPTVVFGSTTYRYNPFMNPAKRQQWDDVSAENLGGYTSGQFLLLGGSQTVSGQPVFNNIILGTATYVLDSALLNGYTSSEIVAISTNLVPSPDLSAYAIKLDVSNSTDTLTSSKVDKAGDTMTGGLSIETAASTAILKIGTAGYMGAYTSRLEFKTGPTVQSYLQEQNFAEVTGTTSTVYGLTWNKDGSFFHGADGFWGIDVKKTNYTLPSIKFAVKGGFIKSTSGYMFGDNTTITTAPVAPDLSAYAIKLDVSNSTDAITTQLYQVAIDTTATINELRDNYARLDSSPTWTGSITTPSVYVSSFVTTQDLNVLGKTRIRMDHATFYSTTTQSIAVVNATQTITLDGTIDSHGGITFDGATGCVTVLDGGSYLIGFSAIPQGTNGNRLFIFPRINNIDVPYSNTIWQFTGGSAPKVETVFYNLDMNAGDEICLIMYSNNASTELLAIPATTVPIAPAMPSIIITVNKTGEQQ